MGSEPRAGIPTEKNEPQLCEPGLGVAEEKHSKLT